MAGVTVRVRVRLFGAFRRYSARPEVVFEVPRGTRVAELRGHLAAALHEECPGFDGQELLALSALAAGEVLLGEGEAIAPEAGEALLAILPPVSGG